MDDLLKLAAILRGRAKDARETASEVDKSKPDRASYYAEEDGAIDDAAATALTAAEARIKALSEALEMIARPTSPERLSGAHLTDAGRGQLAFAMIDNFQAKARQALSTLGGNDDR